MAFRTNLVPAIEERTVSGSSVSFNSAFALPLKACKVSFSATQAGSGDPSPSNPRAISGVSAIGLTANSTPVSVSFGDTRYGGELDLLTGILTVTYNKTVYDGSSDEGWVEYSAYNGFRLNNYYMKIGTSQTGIANWLDIVNARTDFGLVLGANNNTIFASQITNNIAGITDLESWKTFLSTHNLEIVYPLSEPITIQLSANELSSIIGNNTFSTDTGTLEITFSDLQEKSASGAVATFNTALAMPLSSCNIAVNAWQEGSGEPSPSNVRPIHGFSEVNATRAGKNLLDKRLIIQSPAVSQPFLCKIGADSFNSNIPNGSIVLASGQYTFSCVYKNDSSKNNTQLSVYDENGNNLYTRYTVQSIKFTVPKSMAVCFYINCGASGFTSWDDYDIQLEAGSTPTAYEPYVTPTIYTIQLGQEVYGAEVDVVNGVMTVTHEKVIYNGTEAWTLFPTYNGFYKTISNMKSGYNRLGLCNFIPVSKQWNTLTVRLGNNNNVAYFCEVMRDIDGVSDVDSWKQYLSENNLELMYPLNTPFDIQLTPTQIETLIGNNTIFADTGDIDLTYKDLDIAKRGSFREVFKLPS